MRYITVVIAPTEEYLRSSSDQQMLETADDPREIWIDDTLVATQEAIHYGNLLDDGTAVAIVQFRGDADRLAELEDEVPEIISCTVTGGETWLAYLHYEPDEVERAISEVIDTEAISIDWPVRETADGVQVTLFGEDAALQQLIASIPDEMDLRLERAGEYQPQLDDPVAQLTDRQKEIVRAAIAAGYYDVPRRTTQRDLATELGLSQRTIGDHLQRAEAKIIQSVVI
ncbi:helix-turn-helix domain-containing protein [Halosolutus gelatinilyticus]|uniref:helix-turn-helix domain-containing protein n=1 Tax=Halosolutus gelatinilyticus TaxID=2931975 RepID=UPI001FF4383E|nr:helix-turn-helix domain-containing protein [Halosolutus gelatinilyticus]